MRALLAYAAVAASILAVMPAQAAGVYKWIDLAGAAHYDDKNIFSSRVTQEGLNQHRILPRLVSSVPDAFADKVELLCLINTARAANYRAARELYGQDPVGDVYLMSARQVGITIAETDRDQAIYCAPDSIDRLYALHLADLRTQDAAAKTARR